MRVRLYQATRFEDAWESVLRPWFARHEAGAWKAEHSIAVVVPSAATLAYLKRRLLESGLNAFGVSFLTPHVLRKRLLRAWRPTRKVALREDLRLIMGLTAERFMENAVAASIARSPDRLVQTFGKLEAAGRDGDEMESGPYQEVAKAYSDTLRQFGMQTEQREDLELWRTSETRDPQFAGIMVYGFSDRHWHHLALLRAALNTAARGRCVLLEGGLSDSSRVWLGTWEESYGSAEILLEASDSSSRPYRDTALNLENPVDWRPSKEAPGIIYRIAQSGQEEADAIVAQALAFLGETEAENVGVIFAQPSALSREVSIRLTRLGIAHYDGLGHRPGRTLRQSLLEAWIRFQEDQRLDLFLDFVSQLSLRGIIDSSEGEPLRIHLSKVFGTLLTDELPILRAFLRETSRDDRLLTHLDRWPSLPERGQLESLWHESEFALNQIGWPVSSQEFKVKDRIEGFLLDAGHRIVSRRSFLRWMSEVTRIPGRSHSAAGKHPFARVSLLSIDDVDGQDWSHLILADLSSHAWAAKGIDGPELPEDEIKRLNVRVVAMGGQGAGHLRVIGRHGYLLSSAEKRIQAFGRLTRILESTRERVAVTFARSDPSDPRRAVAPSDWLLRLYWTEKGELLDEPNLRRLTTETRLWLNPLRSCKKETQPVVGRTVKAYRARRDGDRPFGRFEFSYLSPPADALRLSATAWDEILRRPATVWLNHVLGVTKRRYFSEKWYSSQTVGIWAHKWLRPPGQGDDFEPLPDQSQWLRSVQTKAADTRDTVARAFEACGRRIPDWWLAKWNEALAHARHAGREISGICDWPVVSGEFSIPHGTAVHLPGGEKIVVPGRMDLLLAGGMPWLDRARNLWAADVPAWIIDLKTSGSARALTRANFHKGNGLQLGFYALALYGFGCNEVEISVMSPVSPFRAQLDLKSLLKIPQFWRGLAEIARSGVLGQLGPIRSSYAFVGEYPLTTLAIDPAILERKWALTHPLLCGTQ